MERWVQTCRHELLDRTLIWNRCHLLHTLREFELFYNEHRPHRALEQAAPLRSLPEPIAEPGQIRHLEIAEKIDLVELFTSTDMPLELGG
jgi:putative transposase